MIFNVQTRLLVRGKNQLFTVMVMSTIVISIGGSVLAPETLEPDYIHTLAALFKRLSQEHKFYLVIGGGALARKYIRTARALGADETVLDHLGIGATRLNARLLLAALGDCAYPVPAETYDEARAQADIYPIVVMGGTEPGHTTDAVATMLGEQVGADEFINVTSVDGVYTADPKLDPNATKLPKLTPDKLIEITSRQTHTPGPHIVIDPLAARVIKRSGMKTYVLDGRDLTALENAIIGKPFNGSIIENE